MENLITSDPEEEQRVVFLFVCLFCFLCLGNHLFLIFLIGMPTLKHSTSQLVYFSFSYASLILSSNFQGQCAVSGTEAAFVLWVTVISLSFSPHRLLTVVVPLLPGSLLPPGTLKLLSPTSPVTHLSNFSFSTHLWTLTVFPTSFF